MYIKLVHPNRIPLVHLIAPEETAYFKSLKYEKVEIKRELKLKFTDCFEYMDTVI